MTDNDEKKNTPAASLGQRINEAFIREFTSAFTEERALKYAKIHHENCHHWDWT